MTGKNGKIDVTFLVLGVVIDVLIVAVAFFGYRYSFLDETSLSDKILCAVGFLILQFMFVWAFFCDNDNEKE